MSEELGDALLDLGVDLAPLDAGLNRAQQRVATFVATTQAMLDSLHGDVMVNVDDLNAAASRIEKATSNAKTTEAAAASGLWGVRGPEKAGSIQNPLVTVIEAAKNTPLGSFAAGIGETNVTDDQQGNGAVADAADIAALRDQIARLATVADRQSAASRLGEDNGSAPAWAMPWMSTSTKSSTQDAQAAAALAEATDALAKVRGQLTQAERSQVFPTAPPAATSNGRQPTRVIYDYSTSSPASGPSGGGGSAPPVSYGTSRATSQGPPVAYSTGGGAAGGGGGGGRIPPVAFDAPGPSGGGGGNKRVDIYYHSDPAKLAAGSRTTYSPLNGLRTVGDTNDALSLANIFKGDEGRGGAFGLPGFGSVGSLAGLGLEHWLLTALGLGSSAVSAGAGAGLLAGGSLATSAVGGGADMLINHDTVTQAKDLWANVQALNQAIAVYGKGSTQAAAAQYQLNQQWEQLGGGGAKQAVIGLDNTAQELQKLFDKESTGAREASADVMEQVLHLGLDYTPKVTAAAQTNLSLINTGLKPLFAWLEGPQGTGIFDQLEQKFASDLPTSMHAFDMGVRDLLRLLSVASQYTGGLGRDLDNIFTEKNGESTLQYKQEVEKLVGDLKEWEGLLKLLAQDGGLAFKQDAGTANSIIGELTTMLKKLHEWEESTTGQTDLQNIFYVHRQEIDQLIKDFEGLAKAYGGFYLDAAPPMVKALTDIAGALDNVVTAVEKVPGGTFLAGLAIVLGKLGILGPGLKATAAALGLMTKAESENVGPATADAAANKAFVGSAAGEEGAVAGGAAAGAEAGGSAGIIGLFEKLGSKAGAGTTAAAGAAGAGLSKLGLGAAGDATVAGGAALGDVIAAALPFVLTAGAGVAVARWIDQDLLSLSIGNTGSATAKNPKPTIQGGGFQSRLPGFLGAGENDIVNGTLSAVGINTKSTENIKEVGSFANYSIDQLQKLISAIKQVNGTKLELNGVSETKSEILGVANAALDTKQKTASALAAATKSVDDWSKDSGSSLKDLTDDFDTSMRAIEYYVGTGSAQGKQLMTQNVNQMVAAVTSGMDDGKVSVQSGMKGIDSALELGVANGALSWTDRWTDMFDTVASLYTHGKITAQQFQDDLNQITTQGDAHISSEVKSSYAETFANLKKQYQQGQISQQQYSDRVHQINQQMSATAKKDMGAFNAVFASAYSELTSNTGTSLSDVVSSVDSVLSSLGQPSLTPPKITAMSATGASGAFSGGAAGAMSTQLAGGTSNAGDAFAPGHGVLAPGHASGALYQIGAPGAAGRDSVPLNIAGQPVVVAPGEQVAVFNRHQQPIVDQALALAGYGGLSGLFSSVTTPNYMAKGGTVGPVSAPGVSGGGAFGTLVDAAGTAAAKAANQLLGKDAAAAVGAGGGDMKAADAALSAAGGGGSVIAQIGRMLLAAGLNKVGAAGIIGNALQESSWNPAAVGDGGGGLWGFTSGAISLASLQAYAASQKQPWTSASVQTEFLLQHLPASDIAALNAQGSPQAAAAWFMNNWERPAVSTENAANREAGAATAFAQGYASGGVVPVSFGTKAAGLGAPAGTANGLLTGISFSPKAGELGAIPGQPGGPPLSSSSTDLDAIAGLVTSGGNGSLAGLLGANLDGSGGEYGSLNEKTTYYQGIWPISDNLWGDFNPADYIDTSETDSSGNPLPPTVYQTQLTASLSDLGQQQGWNNSMIGDLNASLPIVSRVTPMIQAAISTRKKQVSNLQAQIRKNLAKIKSDQAKIRANITKINGYKSKIQRNIDKVTKHREKIKSNVSAIKEAREKIRSNLKRIAELQGYIANAQKDLKDESKKKKPNKTTIANLNSKIGGWQKQITGLQANNVTLGGDPNDVGTGGQIGTLEAQNVKLGGNPDSVGTGGAIGTLEADNVKLGGQPDSVGTAGEIGPLRAENVKLGGDPTEVASRGEIGTLESKNRTLGGDETDVGTGGQIGTLNTAISNLQTELTAVEGVPDTVKGVSGLGGLLGPDLTLQQQITADQAALSPTSIAAALAGAQTSYNANQAGSSSTSTDTSTLQSLDAQAAQLISTYNAITSLQAPVLAAANPIGLIGGAGFMDMSAVGQLPPYGGSFATGGVVPGSVGAPRTIIAHGGEVVTPPGAAGDMHVHISPKMGLQDFVDVRVEKVTRGMSKRASKPRPSQSRGLLTINH